ncbi:MAG: hypothetical protein PCFJNLEI_02551 [Verrucomicrobiae bacterium]|nr:hypothetical protein [Verrucomicrobiae bacterium]
MFRKPKLAIAPVVVWLAVVACSSPPASEKSAMSAYQEGVPGGLIARTVKTSATVTRIDATTRKVTLVGRDGKEFTVKAGPEVSNFAAIQVGDNVTATVTEELVIFLKGKYEPIPDDGRAVAVAVAPSGAKPGGVLADTVQVTATVVGLDLNRHQAKLQFPDGTIKTIGVRQDVDLRQRKIGEEVVLRSTEVVAILVEKQSTNRK